MAYPMDDSVTAEVCRPVPRQLYSTEIAVRARRMTALNNDRKAVKAAIQPGDSFLWPKEDAKQSGTVNYEGATFTLDRFQDEWCYFIIVFPDGKVISRTLKLMMFESQDQRGFYVHAYQPDDQGRNGTVYELRLDKPAGQNQRTSNQNPGGT